MSADLARLPEALRDHGVRVETTDGWLTRGYGWVDFIGQLNHHTAIDYPAGERMAQAMIVGRTDLEGPLCNGFGGIEVDGKFTAWMIAGLRARHAGPGSPVVYEEFLRDVHVNRSARDRGLADSETTHGNRSLFGWEWQHPGTHPNWSDPLLEGVGRCNAALAELAGWSPERSKEHEQWTRRKIDMSWTGSVPDLTRRYLEDDMAITDADLARIKDAVAEGVKEALVPAAAPKTSGGADTIKRTAINVKDTETIARALAADMKELKAAVAAMRSAGQPVRLKVTGGGLTLEPEK